VVHRGGGGQHVGSAGHRENRLADIGEIDVLMAVERHPPAGERVHPEERVVELAEGAPRVGEHVSHVVVNGLGVGDRLAVMQMLSEKKRLGEQTVEGGELEATAHEGRRRPTQRLVQGGAERAAGELREAADRREHPHLREVERAGHHGHRGHRQAGVGGYREQGHDPAQAPAHRLHG